MTFRASATQNFVFSAAAYTTHRGGLVGTRRRYAYFGICAPPSRPLTALLPTGHFERRISFGYDADLALVRAEFDGEMLRVIVPRRMAIMTYWGT